MQLSFQLALFAVGEQSVFSCEPVLSVVSLLNGEAVLLLMIVRYSATVSSLFRDVM